SSRLVRLVWFVSSGSSRLVGFVSVFVFILLLRGDATKSCAHPVLLDSWGVLDPGSNPEIEETNMIRVNGVRETEDSGRRGARRRRRWWALSACLAALPLGAGTARAFIVNVAPAV